MHCHRKDKDAAKRGKARCWMTIDMPDKKNTPYVYPEKNIRLSQTHYVFEIRLKPVKTNHI